MRTGKKFYKAPFHLFWAKPDHPIRITIPDGCRLVVFTSGHSPDAIPADLMPSGDYEIEPDTLPGGSFPIAFQVVDAAYVPMIEKLAPDKVDAIFAAARNPPAPSTGGKREAVERVFGERR